MDLMLVIEIALGVLVGGLLLKFWWVFPPVIAYGGMIAAMVWRDEFRQIASSGSAARYVIFGIWFAAVALTAWIFDL